MTRRSFTPSLHTPDKEVGQPESGKKSGGDDYGSSGGKHGCLPGVVLSDSGRRVIDVAKPETQYVQDGDASESGHDSGEYSTCEETDVETLESFDSQELVASILDVRRKRFFGRAMKELSSHALDFTAHASTRTGGENAQPTSASRPTPSTTQSNFQGQKRGREENGGSGRDDRPNKRQARLPTPPDFQIDVAKFACPFFKRNPQKYATFGSRGSKASGACFGPGWHTVHRVK